MILRSWDDLPDDLRTEEVRKYYDILTGRRGSLAAKRCFDILASAVLLVILSPVFLVLAVAIRLDSPGPALYRQERVTQYGRRFRIHKFRTMVQNADRGSHVTVGGDSRITRVGRVIRSCRLDEIPQLLDVLRGDMTLVGVRPESPKYTAAYTPQMQATLLLPAGVTNFTSICYKDEAALLEGAENPDQVYVDTILPAKMAYNLREIERFSFWRDIRILFMTVFAVLGWEPQEKENTHV